MKNIFLRCCFVAAFAFVTVGNLYAQGLNIPIPYNWRPQNPVPELFINDPSIGYAGMAMRDPAGNPVIKYNVPRLNQPPEVLLFLRVHEYGHIVKGHIDNRDYSRIAVNEAEADCYAGQQLGASDPNVINRVVQIFESIGNTGGDATHGTGLQMAAVIKSCMQNVRFQQPAAIPSFPMDAGGGVGTFAPLSITDNLDWGYDCDVKKEDFYYRSTKYESFGADILRELRDLKYRGEELVDILKVDTEYDRAVEAEQRANDKLDESNEYFYERGFRSPARDQSVVRLRGEARRAAIAARREYREKAKFCEEASVKKKAFQYLIADLDKQISQRCNIGGTSITLINTVWKHSQQQDDGIKTYTLKFQPNGILNFVDYRPGSDLTIDRTGTWVCAEASLKIVGNRFFPWIQPQYILKLDNNILYIENPNEGGRRLYEFVRQ